MAKVDDPNSADWLRHARQHLESLASAGVDWLPAATSIPLDLSPPRAETSSTAEQSEKHTVAANPMSQSLFESDLNPPGTEEQRRQALMVLSGKVAQCTRCAGLAATRTQTVFGVGPLNPDLCFIGEAPGADEDAQGEPFVGAAGQLLNRIIAACGMKREEVYICNILKCRPPGNRQPLPDEAANCREYLERQLELIRPKFICALGASAAQYLLGTKLTIGKLRGRFHDYQGTPVLCTYHPAYLLPSRSPERKKDVWEDMKKLLERMGRPIPQR
jgi:DNA polymerase